MPVFRAIDIEPLAAVRRRGRVDEWSRQTADALHGRNAAHFRTAPQPRSQRSKKKLDPVDPVADHHSIGLALILVT